MIRAKTKVMIQNEKDFFGPGVAAFFHQIQEMGSMRLATQAMEMSYSKGWKLVKRAESELGFPMLIRQIGGKNGGSSELTEEGLDFLKRYDALQKDIQAAGDALFLKHFPDYVKKEEESSS